MNRSCESRVATCWRPVRNTMGVFRPTHSLVLLSVVFVCMCGAVDIMALIMALLIRVMGEVGMVV